MIIAVGAASVYSVLHDLRENHFPEDHVLKFFELSGMDRQYFDFPELYRRGTAFVDAGCFDCSTDIAFAKWCGGEYSKIFAFEPDPRSYEVCLEKGREIRNLILIPAGVAEHPGSTEFTAVGTGASSMFVLGTEGVPAERKIVVDLTTIDETVGEEIVGMIKMDIEGAEYSALLGAEKTIRRDKPLMAISVYHFPGDTVTFMDYLNKLVPEYRFWIRHYYGPGPYETVLYASVDGTQGVLRG